MRIAIIHALRASIDPIATAFRALWPAAETFNILDDLLSVDLAAAGAETPAIQERIAALATYAERRGIDGILYSCSAFGRSIDRVKQSRRFPVLKPNEAMIEEAITAGRRIAVLATFQPTLVSIQFEFADAARAAGSVLDLECRHVPGALAALEAGDTSRHDALILAAARRLEPVDAVVLPQFSMARARAAVEAATGSRVFSTPESAVAKLRRLLGA